MKILKTLALGFIFCGISIVAQRQYYAPVQQPYQQYYVPVQQPYYAKQASSMPVYYGYRPMQTVTPQYSKPTAIMPIQKQAVQSEPIKQVRFKEQPEVKKYEKYHTPAGFQSELERQKAVSEAQQEMAQQGEQKPYTQEQASQRARLLAAELKMEEIVSDKNMTSEAKVAALEKLYDVFSAATEFQSEAIEAIERAKILAVELKMDAVLRNKNMNSNAKIIALQKLFRVLEVNPEYQLEATEAVKQDVIEKLQEQENIPLYVVQKLTELRRRVIAKATKSDASKDELDALLSDVRMAALVLAVEGLKSLQKDTKLNEDMRIGYIHGIIQGFNRINQLPIELRIYAASKGKTENLQQKQLIEQQIQASAANRMKTGDESFNAYRKQLVEQQINEAAQGRAGRQQGQQQEDVLKSIEASAANRKKTGEESYNVYPLSEEVRKSLAESGAARRKGRIDSYNELSRRIALGKKQYLSRLASSDYNSPNKEQILSAVKNEIAQQKQQGKDIPAYVVQQLEDLFTSHNIDANADYVWNNTEDYANLQIKALALAVAGLEALEQVFTRENIEAENLTDEDLSKWKDISNLVHEITLPYLFVLQMKSRKSGERSISL